VRISERKKRLRERSTSLAHQADGAVTRERPAPRARVARPKPSTQVARGATRQPQRATTRPARKRSPRFYLGFGLVGLVLSAVLAETTFANYNSAVNKYPAAKAAYRVSLAHYQQALARYHAAHGHGVVLPKAPTPPHQPTLTILDFMLPILYGVLSVAYLYLGYRTAQRMKAQA
jgi:hypothetical protein